jgi:6-phosphogluconolactonase/glucosamine-6-phosphate isomerase/deaminase
MEAKHVIGMISGNHKAEITRIAIEGNISSQVPASLLRNHSNATIYLDEEAAKYLNKQN